MIGSKRNVWIILLGFSIGFWVTDSFCRDWSIGCSASMSPECGSLVLRNQAIDYELVLSHGNRSGSSWDFLVNRFIPLLESDTLNNTLHITSFWVMRNARLRLPWFEPLISAGLGWCYIERTRMEKQSCIGGMGLRVAAALTWKLSERFFIETALRFQGVPIGSSGEYTDRLGVSISLVRRL